MMLLTVKTIAAMFFVIPKNILTNASKFIKERIRKKCFEGKPGNRFDKLQVGGLKKGSRLLPNHVNEGNPIKNIRKKQ